MKYTIEYHSDIEDDMDWFDIESKNYLRDVVLTIENKNYNLYFSGIERVMYDIINSGQGYFFKKNLIELVFRSSLEFWVFPCFVNDSL